MDLSGVALGGLIGLAGSLIAALVALAINRANLKASEARRHEELRREAYPQFLMAVDQAVDFANAILNDPKAVDETASVTPDDWWAQLKVARVRIDFLGSQDVSTNARAFVGAMHHLIHLANRTHGVLGRNDAAELVLIRSELHVRRVEYVNSARTDLGLPKVAFWEHPQPPDSLEEWFPEPIQLGWRDHLRPAWRLIPERIRGPIRRRFPRVVQGPPA